MLDEDERHPGVGRQLLEQLGERLEPARRRADADDGKDRLAARSETEEVIPHHGRRVAPEPRLAQRVFVYPARTGCSPPAGRDLFLFMIPRFRYVPA